MSNENYKKKNYPKALEETFVEVDYMLLSDEGTQKLMQIQLELKKQAKGANAKLDISEEREIKFLPFQAGCTACLCLITPDNLYCANSGDSRAILVTKSGKIIELSQDHKPDDEGELRRV